MENGKADSKPTLQDIMNSAAIQQAQYTAAMKNETGYQTITTFWADMTLAEGYGLDAVRETYQRICKEWRSNYKYFTEFVLVLNHKIWHYHQKNEALAELYNELWQDADTWANDNFTGEAAEYYFNVTD